MHRTPLPRMYVPNLSAAPEAEQKRTPGTKTIATVSRGTKRERLAGSKCDRLGGANANIWEKANATASGKAKANTWKNKCDGLGGGGGEGAKTRTW